MVCNEMVVFDWSIVWFIGFRGQTKWPKQTVNIILNDTFTLYGDRKILGFGHC